jgi:hypothetical protein
MGSLDCLEVEVESASLGIRTNCSVTGVCKRTGLAIAESSDVIFVATEGLSLGVKSERMFLAAAKYL